MPAVRPYVRTSVGSDRPTSAVGSYIVVYDGGGTRFRCTGPRTTAVVPNAEAEPGCRHLPYSLVTGENRSSSRLVPADPKSTFTTALGPAPSSATTEPRP